MNFTDFLNLADAGLEKVLGRPGFRRTSAGKWNRRNRDELHAVWLQKSSTGPSFCVNLGVHYSFLEKTGSSDLPTGDEIDQTECRIMFRLTGDPAAKDQWWPTSAESVGEVCDLIDRRGLALLDSYSLSGPIAAIECKDIDAGNLGILTGFTKVGACLLLASIHEHLGDRDKCVEAATCGMKHVGMKVGVKKAFKDILRRCGNASP